MSQENLTRRGFLLAAAFGGAALACARANVPLVIPDTPTPSRTPFQPLPPTPTGAPPEVFPPTPTVTEAPRNPFVFESLDFSVEGEVVFNVELDGVVTEIPARILVINDGLSVEEAQNLDWAFRPGERVILSVEDAYRNTFLYLHSGYFQNSPLEAEVFRNYIEGSDDLTITNLGYILERLSSLEGKIIRVRQGGDTEEFEIHAAAQIPHEAKVAFFTDTRNVLDLVSIFGLGNPQKFDYFRHNHGLILSFCGWGPQSASRERTSPDYRYGYTQYVLGLRLLEGID
jgi:hypothetical protein